MNLPTDRRQALVLLQSVQGDQSRLDPAVRQRIRALYFLDDPRTVAERMGGS